MMLPPWIWTPCPLHVCETKTLQRDGKRLFQDDKLPFRQVGLCLVHGGHWYINVASARLTVVVGADQKKVKFCCYGHGHLELKTLHLLLLATAQHHLVA